eukprot:scaffold195574_cov26-Tisochrysis_lutea.AAC.2
MAKPPSWRRRQAARRPGRLPLALEREPAPMRRTQWREGRVLGPPSPSFIMPLGTPPGGPEESLADRGRAQGANLFPA